MKATPVKVLFVEVGYNLKMKHTTVQTQIKRAQAYIKQSARFFEDQERYNKWALDVMKDTLIDVADRLTVLDDIT